MRYDPAKHHRRSIRLKGYDYTSPGAYFVTICVQDRECVLGEVIDGEMQLSDRGRIAAESWVWLGEQYPYATVDAWVVMPNHTHAIITIHDDCAGGSGTGGSGTGGSGTGGSGTGGSGTGGSGTGGSGTGGSGTGGSGTGGSGTGGSRTAPTTTRRKPLGRLVGAFKTVSTKHINLICDTPGAPFWQRNYWEHVIRDEISYRRIYDYVEHNPARWQDDQLHPDAPPNPFNRG